MAKPQEARIKIDVKEKLETQKGYLELRKEYAQALEDYNAVLALFERNAEEPGFFEDEDFLEDRKQNVMKLQKQLLDSKDDSHIPQKLKEGAFDKEFIEAELNKVRGELGEPASETKQTIPSFLRKEEQELIKNNFPLGLYPRGDEVRYDGEQWIVAGYDGYTGRGILKRKVGPGQTEYVFVDRIRLYLENRFSNRELAEAQKAAAQAAEQNNLSDTERRAMNDDDNFDYERSRAEEEARQGEKLGEKFRNSARKAYERFKKEMKSFPGDVRGAIESEREPFKATMKDLKETARKEYESAKATAEDINKDITKAANKFDRWYEGRRYAMTQAWEGIKKANEFRANSKKLAESYNKWADIFTEEAKMRKWVETDFDPMSVDDETLNEFYDRVDKVRERVGMEPSETPEKQKEMLHDVFDTILKPKIAANDITQKKIVDLEADQLKQKLLEINPELSEDPEEVNSRLEVFREELNKEFGRLRQFQVSLNTKRIASLIRSLLNKDYWQEYIYSPLKIFRGSDEREEFVMEESAAEKLSPEAEAILNNEDLKKLLALYTEGQTIYSDRINESNIEEKIAQLLNKYKDRGTFEAEGNPKKLFRYSYTETPKKLADLIYK